MWYPRIDPLDVVPLPKDRNILFYWMPKCAGHSIGYALKTLYAGGFQDYNNQAPNLHFNCEVRAATFFHSHIPSLLDDGFLPRSWFDNAFGFAVVRNTWDRMVSLFHYLTRRDYFKSLVTFDAFIENVAAGEYPKPGSSNLLGYSQANSLLDWLRPRGIWLPHHICRFENLVAEWALISRILGVEHRPLPVIDKSERGLHQEYYTGQTRSLVAQHFAEEIDVFEFTFD